MLKNVNIATIYYHIKTNNLYEVVCLPFDKETGEARVDYKALKEPRKLWSRPLAEFVKKFEPINPIGFNKPVAVEVENLIDAIQNVLRSGALIPKDLWEEAEAAIVAVRKS